MAQASSIRCLCVILEAVLFLSLVIRSNSQGDEDHVLFLPKSTTVMPATVEFIAPTTTSTEPPPFNLAICSLRDANLTLCVQKNVMMIKYMLKDGIPSLGIPPCEPLTRDNVGLEHDRSALIKMSEYSNITVWGVSNFTIVKFDVANPSLTIMKTYTPKIIFHSDCALIGKVLLHPIKTRGVCAGNYTNVITTMAIKFKIVMQNGEKFIFCKELLISMEIGASIVRMYDRKESSNQTGGFGITLFTRSNWISMADELLPTIQSMTSDYFRKFINGIYGIKPSKALFLE